MMRNHQAERPDAIVVGSGPCGVAAARTLLEGGRSVLLVDAGDDCPVPASAGALGVLRRDAEATWPLFLGRDFAALRASEESSPKLRTPRAARLAERYCATLGISTSGFLAMGALAVGGLSNFWGATASVYSGADLATWPAAAARLASHARAIARRIGISGRDGDDLAEYHGDVPLDGDLPVPPPMAMLLDRYARCRDRLRARGFALGRARNAVLTQAKGPRRQGCALDNLCLWGCARGAVYSSAFELDELATFPKFRLERNMVVRTIAGAGGGWRLEAEQHGRPCSLESRTILLAAGAIATTRLVLGLKEWRGPVRLLTNPVFAAGFVMPSMLGRALSEQGFSMAQLHYVLEEAGAAADYAAGALYLTDGLPASEFIARLPLTRPVARVVTRAVMPAMLLATCYLSSDYSDNRVTLRPDGVLAIEGGHAAGAAGRVRLLGRRLRAALRGLGLIAVPGAAALSTPGADFHYAGTLPMGGRGALATTPGGELVGARGLYVVDAACLPRLSAKPPTLTAMANASRIAEGIVSGG
jgi:choline dehydrogenase-like flavoprotein